MYTETKKTDDMNNTILGVAIMVCLFSACNSQKLVGKYKYSQDFVVHKLEILTDSNFVYLVEGDLSTDETQGTWNYKKGNLYLNSFMEYMPYQVNESLDSIDRILITLKDIEGLVISGNYICINQESKKYYVSDIGEIEIFPYQKIKTIEIFSLKGPFKYVVVNANSNRFKITYDSSKSSKLYFLNDKFTVKPNKLFKANNNIVFTRIY